MTYQYLQSLSHLIVPHYGTISSAMLIHILITPKHCLYVTMHRISLYIWEYMFIFTGPYIHFSYTRRYTPYTFAYTQWKPVCLYIYEHTYIPSPIRDENPDDLPIHDGSLMSRDIKITNRWACCEVEPKPKLYNFICAMNSQLNCETYTEHKSAYSPGARPSTNMNVD